MVLSEWYDQKIDAEEHDKYRNDCPEFFERDRPQELLAKQGPCERDPDEKKELFTHLLKLLRVFKKVNRNPAQVNDDSNNSGCRDKGLLA